MSIQANHRFPASCHGNIVHLVLVLALTPCALAANTGRLDQEDDIREVVLRHLLSNNEYAARGERFDGYYLSFGLRERPKKTVDPLDVFRERLTDPSDAFMKRFVDHKATVHKASFCRVGAMGGVLDRRTGKPGLLLSVTTITWLSDTEAKVSADYYRANLASAGFTYWVKKEGRKWKVAEQKMDWIS